MDNRFKLNFEDISFFEKANADPDRKRRIGGIASIETQDRQQETLIQKGLDFSEFVNHGWFNDNHSRETDAVLGYPTDTKFFEKGETLPNGKLAKASGHWVEGYLLDTKKANSIWDLANSLRKTPRRLGFSVEGKIQKRNALDKSIIAKAIVREVAITKAPVNTDAQMDILAKSLNAAVVEEDEPVEKTLTMGSVTPGESPIGPKTGEGVGQILATESLEKKKKCTKKSLTDSEAFVWIQNRLPNANPGIVGRVIEITKTLKRTGKL